MKKIKLEDYKIIEKELKNLILIAYKDYILTDTYIINLRKIHIFKYSDITHMYKKCGIRIVGNEIRIVKYLCTKTNDGLKDKFLISYLSSFSISAPMPVKTFDTPLCCIVTP